MAEETRTYLKGVKLADGTTATFGEVRYNEKQDLTDEQKAQARENIGAASVDQSGGSLEPLIVDIDVEAAMANRHAKEILTAYEEGREICGKAYHYDYDDSRVANTWLSLVSVDEYYAVFVQYLSNTDWRWYRINNFREVESGTSYTLVKKSELGDLDTALAEILAYAQSLTSGGES